MTYLRIKSSGKYGNKISTVKNVKFHSKKEGRRYNDLLALENAGEIENLVLQPCYVLQEAYVDGQGAKHRRITYKADFSYFDKRTGKTVIEDVKGFKTQVYLLKKKLFLKQLSKDSIFVEI